MPHMKDENLSGGMIDYKKHINSMSEQEQLELLSAFPQNIKWIDNPSLNVQWHVIKRDIKCMENINNPDPEIQKYFVERLPNEMQMIENPSDETQIIAVTKFPRAIEKIYEPCEEAQMIAVQHDLRLARDIHPIAPSVQKYMIDKDPNTVRYITGIDENILNECKTSILRHLLTQIVTHPNGKFLNATDYLFQVLDYHVDWPEFKVIKNSLSFDKLNESDDNTDVNSMSDDELFDFIKLNSGDKEIVGSIKHMSDKLQVRLVSWKPWLLEDINNPCEHAKIVAVSRNGELLRYIENPSEEVIAVAVKQNPRMLQYVKNPSILIQLSAVKSSLSSLQYINKPAKEVLLAAIDIFPPVIRQMKNPPLAIQIYALKKRPDVLSDTINFNPRAVNACKKYIIKDMLECISSENYMKVENYLIELEALSIDWPEIGAITQSLKNDNLIP